MRSSEAHTSKSLDDLRAAAHDTDVTVALSRDLETQSLFRRSVFRGGHLDRKLIYVPRVTSLESGVERLAGAGDMTSTKRVAPLVDRAEFRRFGNCEKMSKSTTSLDV